MTVKLKRYQVFLAFTLLIVFLIGVIGLSVVPLGVDRKTHSIKTADGITIYYDLYYPSGTQDQRPVIVMGHGVIVNKEMMASFARELAGNGFIVACIDWRGHGQSTGYLNTSRLGMDLAAVLEDISHRFSLANMSALGLAGYSMGGRPTYEYASTHPDQVKAWVGVGTSTRAASNNESSPSIPHNVLVINGEQDEAFELATLKDDFAHLLAQPVSTGDRVLVNHLYGDLADGTARKILILPAMDHLTVPWDPRSVAAMTSWFVETFYGEPPARPDAVYYQRIVFFYMGLAGLVGIIYGFSLFMARMQKPADDDGEGTGKKQELEQGNKGYHDGDKTSIQVRDNSAITPDDLASVKPRSFIARYYFHVLVFPGVLGLIPIATLMLLPLPFTAFLAVLVGGLAINILFFIWLLLKKMKLSFKSFLSSNIKTSGKSWMIGIISSVIFMAGFYLVVGQHYIGTIPSINRLVYLPLFALVLFFSLWIYDMFGQKMIQPLLKAHLGLKSKIGSLLLESFLTFVLVFSWNCIIILVPCTIANNYFFAMILILMAPIDFWATTCGTYMDRLTGSTIPNAVMQSIMIAFFTLTLSPFVSVLEIIAMIG
ncbi:MAG: alpha/beta hydrolase [Promethearchaeota archaeon]